MSTGMGSDGRVVLYTTAGCHLCEQALQLLEANQLQISLVEIADDDQLFERYGLRIPVAATGAGEELDWPFDQQQLQAWLEGVQLKSPAGHA